MPTITNTRDDTRFLCEPGDTVLRAALRAGIGMPYSCNTGSCGNCRFDLVEGEVSHLRDDPPGLSEKDRAKNRWLGCQAVPGGDCQVKFRTMDQYVPPVTPARRGAELQSVEPITRDISEFAFRVDGAGAFSPGQYALLTVPGVEGARAYSMSNLAGDTWRFMIKRAPGGAATGWLFDAAPGATLEIDGPFGTAFLREDSDRDIVLLAGGSGLSPMVSIALGAVAAGLHDNRKIHLFYGCRETADLCTPDVLGPAQGKVGFTAALSDPEDGADWEGPTGFLHDVVRDQMGEALKDCDLYFAGPAVMSAAVQQMAHEAGMPMDRLFFDEFY
ncbi:2Fe-2S iron-sulfur cluster-binding protein [Ovoidimarina sediminis]|uniref:2Fe-2S iron-sulfur cluster-binding protein n=1 Tax=Ovoidimarina sediminis TaxID=3079856 RepID=UPI0029066F8B|nr:2Fe-2S iron-sulfur cluster-binding protein [Rhodophyticola sp. MJ-SS7]MDU8941778.1 2Fe-2S iron-sulfur cluster-binding protein [Rhodophyticola sp. MJ-SS7]